MSERREKYHAVNSQWPDVIPELTGPEAISAAKRLYRFAMKRPYKGKWKLTSGRRYTWQRSGTFYVNPKCTSAAQPGWHDLVHMMSHYCHRKLFPGHKPHDGRHHFLEREMVAYVLKSGWLDGKLKPKSAPATERPAKSSAAVKLDRVGEAEKRWTTKFRRAETALRKLKRQRAYYEKRV